MYSVKTHIVIGVLYIKAIAIQPPLGSLTGDPKGRRCPGSFLAQ